MQRDVLQQRIEAELIAARLFRFRARRGLGVFYSLISIIPLVGLILYNTVALPFAVAGELVSILAVWFVARSSGFGGVSKMQYSLDFLKGERGTVYDEKGERRSSWRRNLAWFLATLWPWFGYTIASAEGDPYLAAFFLVVFAAELVLILSVTRSTKGDRVLERRVEDWAFVAGDVLVAFVAILPGAPDWTWALASPLFIFCGTKSLYDAPKELALVAS
ncbi:MAG: hypothetical protein ABSF83_01125 [Nitrososphaerales archaeon]